jgi:hypothetical protein
VFVKENPISYIVVYQHTDKYFTDLMEEFGFRIVKGTEFAAFEDIDKKTFFRIVLAKKCC